MRVLLAEDDMRLGKLIQYMLEQNDIDVEWVTDGNDIYSYATYAEYDILILDWMMPGETGVEACARLRRNGYDRAILMLTARDSVEDRVTGLDAGAVGPDAPEPGAASAPGPGLSEGSGPPEGSVPSEDTGAPAGSGSGSRVPTDPWAPEVAGLPESVLGSVPLSLIGAGAGLSEGSGSGAWGARALGVGLCPGPGRSSGEDMASSCSPGRDESRAEAAPVASAEAGGRPLRLFPSATPLDPSLYEERARSGG